MRFTGQVAIVTGSGSGIGRAVARQLAAEGAALVLNDRAHDRLEAMVEALCQSGARAVAVPGDIADPKTADELTAQANQQFGKLDVLVNNAALFFSHDFISDSFERWRSLIEVNLFGAVHCARAAAKAMIAGRQSGRIVNVSSVHAFLAEPGSSHYDVAKGGLNQLTRALAVELAPAGILVNGVAPGFVNTAMSVVDGINELETETFREIYVKRRRIPLARPAEPDELAQVILFLASRQNSYMTGETVVVDGGLSVTF